MDACADHAAGILCVLPLERFFHYRSYHHPSSFGERIPLNTMAIVFFSLHCFKSMSLTLQREMQHSEKL